MIIFAPNNVAGQNRNFLNSIIVHNLKRQYMHYSYMCVWGCNLFYKMPNFLEYWYIWTDFAAQGVSDRLCMYCLLGARLWSTRYHYQVNVLGTTENNQNTKINSKDHKFTEKKSFDFTTPPCGFVVTHYQALSSSCTLGSVYFDFCQAFITKCLHIKSFHPCSPFP